MNRSSCRKPSPPVAMLRDEIARLKEQIDEIDAVLNADGLRPRRSGWPIRRLPIGTTSVEVQSELRRLRSLSATSRV